MEGQSTSGPNEGFPDLSESVQLQKDIQEGGPIERNDRLLSDVLMDEEELNEARLTRDSNGRLAVIVELNIRHKGALRGAAEEFANLFREATDGDPAAGGLTEVTKSYIRCRLSRAELLKLAALVRIKDAGDRPIYHVWPDFPIRPLMDTSIATIKGDAARRAYDATGRDIVWAVIDSGIDHQHPHFTRYDNFNKDGVGALHKDFTDAEQENSALNDEFGHGTHVAGIIAGGLEENARPFVQQRVMAGDELDFNDPSEKFVAREVQESGRLSGVAPRCKLVSLKVLDDTGGSGASSIMRALQYVREELNDDPKVLRVHGVNLSVGYPFNARWFACGQSPICVEVDRLVKSGVVVVVAAGNTGYGPVTTPEGRRSTGLSLSINDPGNSALAITVGATHRDSPHTYGVSYFSSKGPTGDGRMKPDLLAPGERITSCAAGKALRPEWSNQKRGFPAYVDRSGTSMAAPHVSGAIAAFLSIRREFIGRPDEVKRIFMDSATSLGREPYFQGRGVVDLMRAIQSV